MEKVNKIYLHENSEFRLRYLKDGATNRIYSEPPEDKEKYIEFTNLSSVWHDARKEKHPEGVCGNNPVVVVGLRNGRISYRYLWEDIEDCWLDLETLAECKTYDKTLWAYLRDLVPGVKPRGL